MSNKNTFKCPNCPRQFLSQRSLRLHLPSCRKSHLLTADAHSQIEYHPLRSLRHFDDQDLDGCSQCIDADIDDNDSEMDNVFKKPVMTSPSDAVRRSDGRTIRVTSIKYNDFLVDIIYRHGRREIRWQDNFTKFTLLFFLLLLGTANSPSTNRISNSVW